jgi:hypothetical protein
MGSTVGAAMRTSPMLFGQPAGYPRCRAHSAASGDIAIERRQVETVGLVVVGGAPLPQGFDVLVEERPDDDQLTCDGGLLGE